MIEPFTNGSINAHVIGEAIVIKGKYDSNKKLDVEPDDMKLLALAVCIGDDKDATPLTKAMTMMVGYNSRLTTPWDAGTLTGFVLRTIEAVEYRIEFIVEAKKVREKQKKEDAEHVEPESQPEPPSPEVLAKARKIYESGKFIEYCKDTFRKVWYKDEFILEALMYQAGNARLGNPDEGVHLHIAGDTQIGKSDSVRASLTFVHPSDKLTKQLSPMGIFYDPGLHEKITLFRDDVSMSPEEAEAYRAILTSWKTGCVKGVVVNFKLKNLHIPKRVSLILTSVDSVCTETDEAQDESRFLTVTIQRSKDDMRRIREFVQQPHPDITEELKVVYAIWDLMIPESVNVNQHRIFDDEFPIREFKRYLTMIKTRALLMGRSETTDNDVVAIKGFLSYSTPMINSTTAGLGKYERVVDAALNSERWTSIIDIQKATGLSYQQVVRAIRGKTGTLQSPTGGLLVKTHIQMAVEHNDVENNISVFRKSYGGGSVATTI